MLPIRMTTFIHLYRIHASAVRHYVHKYRVAARFTNGAASGGSAVLHLQLCD